MRTYKNPDTYRLIETAQILLDAFKVCTQKSTQTRLIEELGLLTIEIARLIQAEGEIKHE